MVDGERKTLPSHGHILFFSTFMSFYVSVVARVRHGSSGYTSISFDASMFPSLEYYDYIIVGGGTAGCPLAATLSVSYKVLLLERGGSPLEYPEVMTREGFVKILSSTRQPRHSPVHMFTSREGVRNMRGRVLGGSSAINAGFYSRADPGFFREGCGPVDWDMAMVNKSYEWVEKAVAFKPVIGRWQRALREALVETDVLPYNGFTVHHVRGTKVGASTFDREGRRHSAADLLRYARAANIRVALRAIVERILLTGPSDDVDYDGRARNVRATGVIYMDRFRKQHRALTNDGGEVILCAGAIGSPQLLLLSGIGPWNHLSRRRIPMAVHLPSVGKFMHDNPLNGISISSPIPLDLSVVQVVGITHNGVFIEAASDTDPSSRTTVATIMAKVSGPLSSGYLVLTSLDARDNPAIRFNYYQDERDLKRCVSGLRKIVDLMDSQSMEVFKFPEWSGTTFDFRYIGSRIPTSDSGDDAMERFCRETVVTMWHYHGGCVAGKVVDEEFRVIDVDSLRVVDGSTFIRSPGTNPQATVMMLGRYVGLRIIRERRNREGN